MLKRKTSKVAMYKKTHVYISFRFSFRGNLCFYLMNALVYVVMDQGIPIGEKIELGEIKSNKTARVFL